MENDIKSLNAGCMQGHLSSEAELALELTKDHLAELGNISEAGAERVPEARIATALAPRMTPHFKAGALPRIRVVGFSSPNVDDPDYTEWRATLEQWLFQAKSHITYFLIKPSDRSLDILRELARNAVQKGGKLDIVKRDCSREGSPQIERLAKEWETFHFVHCENPSQLWVESYHPPGETVAYDCYYYSPEAVAHTALADIYRFRFEQVLEQIGAPAIA